MTTQQSSLKQQQCSVPNLVFSWLIYLAGFAYMGYERHWAGGLFWLVLVPCVRLALYKGFPNISRFLGYGRVDDQLPASANVSNSHVAVSFYSFFSCPFCPIVLQRLEALQKQMGFTLEKIDVTLKPQILMSKGILTVPVVEVGKNRLVGNATTEQLSRLIGLAQPLELSKAS
jgi:hypothetical protein